MKKATFCLPVMLSVLAASAQRDSSKIDIGWLSLDKGLTQVISIKGAELEKMPFVDLSDAIAAWLYGAYTNPGLLTYVVDGNPVTDVNIYPIFDIEEVTLVENATAAAGYGGTQQELVVIRTKRGTGAGGMRVTGQAGLVKVDGDGRNTNTEVYHQYYAGVYRNLDKLSFGVSADWIRDVNPVAAVNARQENISDNLQRWRLNGYLVWRPAGGNTVELRVGYAPQRMKQLLDTFGDQTSFRDTFNIHEHLIVPQLLWHWNPLPGLTNSLQAEYLTASWSQLYSISSAYVTDTTSQQSSYAELQERKVGQVFIRDRMAYDLAVGGWHIGPSLNFLYEHIDERTADATTTAYLNGGVVIPVYPVLGALQEQKGSLFFVTPAVDFRLGRAFDLQAGVQVNASHRRDSASRVAFPFATVGLDVLHFGQAAGGSSLKIFGSYAQRPTVFVNDYGLYDFSGGGAAGSLKNINHPSSLPAYISTNGGDTQTVQVPVPLPPVYWTWEAGVAFATPDGRWSFQYVFERRNFSTSGTTYISNYGLGNVPAFPEWRSELNHADVRVRVLDGGELSWVAGLSATSLRSNLDSTGPISYMWPTTGDIQTRKVSWTGGWVNRLEAGPFRAGLDLMYHFGERQSGVNGSGVAGSFGPKVNSVLVPNVYAGYRLKLAGDRELEFFLESRGAVRSKNNDLLDERRYYTFGGNFTL
jgi:hypothetical protein